MVDMSPEAVTQRLRLMDELWELSVKLMNAEVSRAVLYEHVDGELMNPDAETQKDREVSS